MPMQDRIVRLCRQLAAAVSVASVAGSLAGCLSGGLGGEPLGGNYHPGGLGGAGGAGAAGASSGSGGTNGAFGPGPDGEPFCGTLYFGVAASVQRDILIVMDRASSMNDDSDEMSCAGGCGASSKWALLSAAVERLVTAHPSVNWGLALYGSDDACGASAGVAVDVAPDAASSIAQALAATTPGGDAPTAAAIFRASSYLQTRPDASAKYILLATDGRSGCANAGSGAAGADVEAENAIATALRAGIPTFVLGIAPASDATATATLNQMAENGGEPSPGSASAFSTIDSIDMQLAPIAATSSASASGNPCVIDLPFSLVAGTSLEVSTTTADGQSVVIPEDPLVGWSFTSPDDSAIGISGSACPSLRSGVYSQVAISYVCGGASHPTTERIRPSAR
jgi:hypothetical protein